MLLILVPILILHVLCLVNAQSPERTRPTRPIIFEDLPQCAQYCYLESAKDSPCRNSRDRYCLCDSPEIDKLLEATHIRAMNYCESKAPVVQAMIEDWLNFICEPRSGVQFQRRWIAAPTGYSVLPSVLWGSVNTTDSSSPSGAVVKGAGGLRHFKRGTIAGVVVAAVVGVGILVLGVFFCYVAWLGNRLTDSLGEGLP